MIELDKFKVERIHALRERLAEINELVELETTLNMSERNDAFAERIKMKNVEAMKNHYDEMVSIKIEIARLEGRKSFFEKEDD